MKIPGFIPGIESARTNSEQDIRFERNRTVPCTTTEEPLMAQKPQRASVQSEVMTRITRLMQKEPSPHRAVLEVETIVANLRQQGDAEQVQGWLEEMRDGFAEATEAAAEAVDEVEAGQKAERRKAENAVVCLREISRAFGRALAEPVDA